MKKLSWSWKRKPTWRNYLITYNAIYNVFFDLTGYHMETGGRSLKLEVQGQRTGRILDVDGQGDGESWKLESFRGLHMWIVPKGSSFYDFWSAVFEKSSSVVFVAFTPHSIFIFRSVSPRLFFIEKLPLK